MKELTVFKLELGNTTFIEWKVRPNVGTALKFALVGVGAIGAGLGSWYAVDWLDDLMTPHYVTKSSLSPLPEPTPEWQRPTRWDHK